jgi:PUB domain
LQSAPRPAVKVLEDIIDDVNKLRNRATILTALKHLCSIVRKIINNPSESGPRKLYKTDDVLVEELFVLPEAVELIRKIGFRDEPTHHFYDGFKLEELAEIHAMLTRKREVIAASVQQAQPTPVPVPVPVPEPAPPVESKKTQIAAGTAKVKEPERQDDLQKQKDLEKEANRSNKTGDLSQASDKSNVDEGDMDDCISEIGNDEQMKKTFGDQ